MGKIDIERLKRIKGLESSDEDPKYPLASELWDATKFVGRGIERVARLSGLGVGTAFAASPLATPLRLIPGVDDWLPDVSRSNVWDAAGEFWEFARQGDIDAAIEAYQEELDAGWGFWGLAEIGGSVIPTGGPFLAGGRLIAKAPTIARGVSRLAPRAIRPGVETGLEETIKGVGKVARLPWQAEEAIGRAAVKPFVAGYRLLRPGAKVVEEAAEEFFEEAAEEGQRLLGAPDAPLALPAPRQAPPTAARYTLSDGADIREFVEANPDKELWFHGGSELFGVEEGYAQAGVLEQGFLTRNIDEALGYAEDAARHGEPGEGFIHVIDMSQATVGRSHWPGLPDNVELLAPVRPIKSFDVIKKVEPPTAAPVAPVVSAEDAQRIAQLKSNIARDPVVRRGSENYGILASGPRTPEALAKRGREGIEPPIGRTAADRLEGIKDATDEVANAEEGLSDAIRQGEPEDIAGLREQVTDAKADLALARKPLSKEAKENAPWVEEFNAYVARQDVQRQKDIKELAELEAKQATPTPTAAPVGRVAREIIADYPETGPERYTREWRFGASPYEGLPVRETGVPLRGGREAENVLDTREGIQREITHINKLIDDANIAKRRAQTGGAKRPIIEGYNNEIALRKGQVNELQERLKQTPIPPPSPEELLTKRIERNRPAVYQQEFRKALDEALEAGGLRDESEYWSLKAKSPNVDYFEIEEKALQATSIRLRNARIAGEKRLIPREEFPLNAAIPRQQAGELLKAADPSGGVPPKKPPGLGEFGAIPEDADDVFGLIEQVALKGENVSETIMRRHSGAINAGEISAKSIAVEGERKLHAIGVSVSRGGREVIKSTSVPEMDNLHRALHSGQRESVPERLREVYDEIRQFTDWEEAFRVDFDPYLVTTEEAYFYRGWRMGKELKSQFRQAKGQLGSIPAFAKKRNLATYDEMRDAGFEPLSWNPYEQWRISRLQGIRYRQQSMLISTMKARGLVKGLTDEDIKGFIPEGWRVPEVGPAFQGKPRMITDPATGRSTPIVLGQMIVPDTKDTKYLATRLELLYGRPFDGFKVAIPILGKEVDLLKVIDAIVFIPKRVKLMFSFFQQIDFLSRSWAGTWTQMVDELLAGNPVGAVKHLATWPKSAHDILRANLSPGYREALKKELVGTWDKDLGRYIGTPIIEGRPGIHLPGMVEAGLSVRDETIFPLLDEMSAIATAAAQDAGVFGRVKAVGRVIAELESAMRRGLFDGVYVAAQITDIKNNVAQMFVRKFPNATDEQINGMIAKHINTKYSTIPAAQSVFQKRWLREVLKRMFFSIGESEGLLRQATGAIRGPNAALWRKHWAGTYLSLLATANVIHFASTADYKKLASGDIWGGKGENLPFDRWVPLDRTHYGFLGSPIGYRRDFVAPTIPFEGRNATEVTIDLAGQMDTAFRILDPMAFLNSRLSVPMAATRAQIRGKDFFGAPIDEVGPGGIISRGFALMVDMLAPIGIGQTGVDIARERVPIVAEILPPGDETIGTAGQLLQATGVNIRGEATRKLRDRAARESGYTIAFDPERIGQPIEQWDDLTDEQKRNLEKDHPTLSEELTLRTELQAQRGGEFAQIRVERRKHEGQLARTVNEATTKYLTADPDSSAYRPKAAKPIIFGGRNVLYKELHGTVFDEELGQFTGGLYDPTDEFEDPEEGTARALQKRYRDIFDEARNPDGTTDYKIVDKLQSKLWADLDRNQTIRLLRDIRGTERRVFTDEALTLVNAGRYASAVRHNIDGQMVNYWEIEDLPWVREWISLDSGATLREIEEYMKAPYGEREDMRRPENVYDEIKKSLSLAERTDGVLGLFRMEFMTKTEDLGPEWFLAMYAAGNNFLLDENIIAELMNRGLFDEVQELPYEDMYIDLIAAR